MFGFIKGMFRVSVITLLLGGVVTGAVLYAAGPKRTKAMLHKVQADIQSHIDQAIDDPAAMRSQLQELEEEYPRRIAQVRGDLAELREQTRQLEREKAICEKVVSMAENDLSGLEPLLAQAREASEQGRSARALVVSFNDSVMSLDRAVQRTHQIRNTRIAYLNRSADAEHDLAYLYKQDQRLEELLLQLEDERAQFQAQIIQLSRQVDAIARNERLIQLLDKRNKTIEECSRYDAISLDLLTSRLSEIKSRQEAELDFLSNSSREVGYEDQARLQLRAEEVEVDWDEVADYADEFETALRK